MSADNDLWARMEREGGHVIFRCAAAPWSTSLKAVSGIATVALLAAGIATARAVPSGTRVAFAEAFGTLVACVPPLIALIAVLFVVRSYEVGPGELRIGRLLWSSRIDLAGLTRAFHDPAAMAKSLRVLGNGGLYSFTGLYQSHTLGRYRAFVTDPKRAVVLRMPGRTLVISPEDPRVFLDQLRTHFPGVELGPPP
jgi:hypothetical protein